MSTLRTLPAPAELPARADLPARAELPGLESAPRWDAPRQRGREPVPGPSVPPSSAVALLRQARAGLVEAETATEPAERYAAAHLAALRAAAAVLAVRAKPARRRARPASVWVLLAGAAPEFAEWAAFFAAGSRIRSAVQAGVTRLVSARDADDLVRQTGQFIELVARHRMHREHS